MYKFVACDTIKTVGTCLQGKVTTTYDKLVEVFGEPTMTDASPYEKVNAQWSVNAEDENNTTFTIYNWKDGYVPTEEYEWYIGGFDFNAYCVATDILDNAKEIV